MQAASCGTLGSASACAETSLKARVPAPQAHALKPRESKLLLSAANMELKLGRRAEAAALYGELTYRALTPRQHALLYQKMGEVRVKLGEVRGSQ